MTTKEDLDSLWVAEEPTFDKNENKAAYREFKAGSITTFECDKDCLEILFVREKQVIMKKTPPGRMDNVPSDIKIIVNGGVHGGRSRGH